MRATDEGATGQLIAEQVAPWNRPAPKTGPTTSRTPRDRISQPPACQRYLDDTCTVERAR